MVRSFYEYHREMYGLPLVNNELFAALDCNRDRALVAFYISTGARASELLGVCQGLVVPEDQVIGVVRKGSRAYSSSQLPRTRSCAHFELRKVALGTCGRDHGTPCAHENACVRCPLLRVDPAQLPRLEAIHADLVDRLDEVKEHGWPGEVAAIETTMAAAAPKLETMRAASQAIVHFGMPGVRRSVGRPNNVAS